jgi:uncharacterized protein YndB with AHSA1/START domain
MSEATAATRSVVIEREVSHPPEKIWRALTQPHLIEDWLMQNDFRPVTGHRFTLRRQPRPDVNINVDCEVLAVDPHRSLSYTWNAYGLQSVVTWTLTPTTTGTLLRMEQAGFRPDQSQAFHGARLGWREFFSALEQLLSRA